MKWVVGLGNPGPAYAATRHNVGFMAVDQFAVQHGCQFRKQSFRAEMAEGMVDGEKMVLLKPMTFMNLSGEAVRACMDFYKWSIDDMIVIYDDLDTPLGQIRLRYQGGHGGHNGIRSIIQHLGTQQFKRIRIGISRPPLGAEVVDYVLSAFPKAGRTDVTQSLDRVCDAVAYALHHTFDQTMAKFNG